MGLFGTSEAAQVLGLRRQSNFTGRVLGVAVPAANIGQALAALTSGEGAIAAGFCPSVCEGVIRKIK